MPPLPCRPPSCIQDNVFDFLKPKSGRRLSQQTFADGIIPGVIPYAGVGSGYDHVSAATLAPAAHVLHMPFGGCPPSC